MQKSVVDRIAYFLRKLAERTSHHPAKKLPRNLTYRSERLKLYKRLLHEEIEKSGYKK